MPFKHVNKDGSYGSLNNSITVKELMRNLQAAINVDPSVANKAVLISDDEEGNGFHGAYYAVTADPEAVRGCLTSGCGDWEDDAADNAIIIG